MARRAKPAWADLSDGELLCVRLSDLGLRIEGTPLADCVARLHAELAERGLRFKPHVWLSSSWFSPDGVPGIAAPFYLAHPRLMRLERAQMHEVEGGTPAACMRMLRHEAGHAVTTAFRLHRRKRWREAFGSFTETYESSFVPRPPSRDFVLHLDLGYAASHPAEDFAETFAVWLDPRSDWRARYAGWPALAKLQTVDALMTELSGRSAPVKNREQTERLATLTTTLREHYASKRARYGAEPPRLLDPLLRRLFPERESGRRRADVPAAGFLRKHRSALRRAVAEGTGRHPLAIDRMLTETIDRAKELDLRLHRRESEALADATVILTVQTMNHLHSGSLRLPR